MEYQGDLRKMRTTLDEEVRYFLGSGDSLIEMNGLLGTSLHLAYSGEIHCLSCGRTIKKPFGQGFCYPCFRDAPEAAECIIRPELCEAHLGKGRDPEWEERNHNQPHVVYLALSSGVKVGITRETQVPTRWIDQGASKALVIARVPYRRLAGEIEVALKEHFTDKTNWQRMLKNQIADDTLLEAQGMVSEMLEEPFQQYLTAPEAPLEIPYPVLVYPEKVKSINLLKLPEYDGKLTGIKGQYLIFEDGMVFNVRNHSGFHVRINA